MYQDRERDSISIYIEYRYKLISVKYEENSFLVLERNFPYSINSTFF